MKLHEIKTHRAEDVAWWKSFHNKVYSQPLRRLWEHIKLVLWGYKTHRNGLPYLMLPRIEYSDVDVNHAFSRLARASNERDWLLKVLERMDPATVARAAAEVERKREERD